MSLGYKIFGRTVNVRTAENVHNNKLDFHFFGNKGFYVNACVLTYSRSLLRLGKSRQIRGKLHKNAVILNAADYGRRFLPKFQEAPYGRAIPCRRLCP